MVRLFQRAYNMESPMDTYFQCHFTKLVIKGPLNHVRSHKLLILEDTWCNRDQTPEQGSR